jgi:anti-anti-sigma factor
LTRQPISTHHLEVDVEQRDGVHVVRPRGELDMFSAPALRDLLRNLRRLKASVRIDLREVTFMDSSGLRLIWDADAACKRDGIELTLVKGPPDVMRVFDVTGLAGRLPFVDPD